MLIEGRPGPSSLQDGATATVRLGKDGAVATQDAHARYQEAVYRGNTYWVSDAAGAQMPAGLSNSPVTVSLFNPKNSGVNLVILYASVSNKVALAAAAIIWIAANTNPAAAAVTGTAGSTTNAMIGNGRIGAALALTTATLPATPTQVMVLGVFTTGAITTTSVIPSVGGFIDGMLIVQPGAALSFQASTQSGAAGCMGSWCWEEVPV